MYRPVNVPALPGGATVQSKSARMTRLSVSTYVEFHQATNRAFDPLCANLLLWAVSCSRFFLKAFIHRPAKLFIAGFVCYAASRKNDLADAWQPMC
jgi:hypothetical protein